MSELAKQPNDASPLAVKQSRKLKMRCAEQIVKVMRKKAAAKLLLIKAPKVACQAQVVLAILAGVVTAVIQEVAGSDGKAILTKRFRYS